MKPFTKKVYAYIQRHQLLKPGQTLLIGVSGGADSLALLHSLNELRLALGINLVAGHVNHQLRRGADADAEFVKKICRELNIPFSQKRVKIPRDSKKSSLEERAREARQKALIAMARPIRADAIVLAHHRDDLAETVLMRMLRAAGWKACKRFSRRRKFPVSVSSGLA